MSEIVGLDALIAKLGRMPDRLHRGLRNGVQQTTIKAAADARSGAPSGGRSQSLGRGSVSLRMGIQHKLQDGHTIVGTVESTAPHSQFVEFGTGPVGAANNAGTAPGKRVTYATGPWKHPKNPKRGQKQYRRNYWVYPDGNGNFYATRGQPARPFLYPAAKDNEAAFEQIIRQNLLQQLRGVR